MNHCLTKSQLILKSVLAPILVLLVAQIILAEQRELPAASAQRILRSVHAPNPSRLTPKKPAASPHALTSTPVWIPAQNCPVAVARYGFAQVGGLFYVISGITDGGTVSTGVYRFGPGRSWNTLAPIPVGSEGPVAAYSAYDNKIYVADGYGGQNLLRIYDIASNTWTSATARPGVTDSYGAAAGAYNGQINIAGGNTGGANNVLSNYNIPNGVWTTYNNMPSRSYGAGFAQVGRFLYLAGGYGITAANSNLTMRLDMATITWTTGPTFTPQKADFALAASASKLFAIGGDANGGGFFDPSVEVDELETAAWPSGSWVSSPPDLPSPRQGNSAGFFSVARMGGEIWSTGGITSNAPPSLTATADHLFRANPCPSIFFFGPASTHATAYPATSGTQMGNVTNNGVQSACGAPKTFPGIVNPTISFPFDRFSFTNNGPAACVTFTIDTACSGNQQLFAVAYLGSYDPTNLATNYLGDLGSSPPASKTFSVDVPANATVVLVVQQFVSPCDLYNVTVTGLNCSEFCNSDGPILIPAGAGSGSTSGPAGPYPSLVSVSGVPGRIASMSVELKDCNHTFSADIDALLVSPTGQKMIIMSDAGSDTGLDAIATIILRDAGVILPTSVFLTGLYIPTNYEPANDTFPGPAPAGPYNDPGPGGTPAGSATLFSSFTGFNPNGNWQLFINDDASGDVGFVNSWCLKFNTIVLQLTNAASRKVHGSTPFDINLPLTGNPGVECRSAGAGGSHTLVFTFTTNVVSGSATVTGGTGVAGAAAFSGNTMSVPLSGVTDQQKITVTLNNVTDASSQVLPATSVSMNVLLGDTTGNKTVNATDVSQVKSQSGAAISAANFRNDTNVNGTINATDVSQVKLNSGHGVP